MTDEQVTEARARYRAGEPLTPIAADYGVTLSCLWNAVIGRTYKHLPHVDRHPRGWRAWVSAECHPGETHRARGLCDRCYGRLTSRLRFLRKLGISDDEYLNQIEEQENKCLICRKHSIRIRLVIDHDHDTGKFRGLLCFRCNKAFGAFEYDDDVLVRASEYMIKIVADRQAFFAQDVDKTVHDKESK